MLFALGIATVTIDMSPGGALYGLVTFHCGCQCKRPWFGGDGPSWRCPAHQQLDRLSCSTHDWVSEPQRTYTRRRCTRCGTTSEIR